MHSTNANETVLAEKELLNGATLPTTSSSRSPSLADSASLRRQATMSRIQHVCLVLLTLAFLAVTFVHASAIGGQAAVTDDAQQFRQLLETIDDNVLHEILHEHFKGKYKHGIFEEDKAALESLHRENAAAATSLVQLAKRQDNGTGITITSTAVTETTQEVTITSTPTVLPPPETTAPPPETTTEPPPPPPTTTSTNPPVENTPTPTPTPSTSLPPVETSSSTTISSETSTLITTTSSSSTTTSGTSFSTAAILFTSRLLLPVQACTTRGAYPTPCNRANFPMYTLSNLTSDQNALPDSLPEYGFNCSLGSTFSSFTNSSTTSSSTTSSSSSSSTSTLSMFPYYSSLFRPPFPNITSNYNLATTSRPVSSSTTRSSRPPVEEDVTTEIFYTTTLADGGQSIVTRITVVPAPQATQSSRPPSGTGSNPSLQTNAANPANQQSWMAGLGLMGMVAAWAL